MNKHSPVSALSIERSVDVYTFSVLICFVKQIFSSDIYMADKTSIKGKDRDLESSIEAEEAFHSLHSPDLSLDGFIKHNKLLNGYAKLHKFKQSNWNND